MTETTWTVETTEELNAVAGELLGIWAGLKNQNDTLVVALSGDLGAGKTTFVQELAKLLQVKEIVNSPTFVIMKLYETEDSLFEKLVHIDAYRIEDPSEMTALHFSEIVSDKNSLICIEWAEKISNLLPEGTVKLELEALPHSKHKITYHGA
jgi:tRNA threonylcarbamoyladenosine biosynthesis protein TsaE